MSSTEQYSETDNTPRGKVPLFAKLVGLIFFLIWAIVAIPGNKVGGGGTSGAGWRFFQHGWPFVHFNAVHSDFDHGMFNAREREKWHHEFSFWVERAEHSTVGLTRAVPVRHDTRFWSEPGNWQYFGEFLTGKFRLPELLINLLIGLAIIILPMSYVNYRIRKYGRLFKIRLWESLLLTVVVWFSATAIINECTSSTREHRAAKEFVAVIDPHGIIETGQFFDFESRLPGFLSRLVDGRTLFPTGVNRQISIDRVSEIDLVEVSREIDRDELNMSIIQQLLSEFKAVRSLYMGLSESSVQLVESIPPAMIQNLEIVGPDRWKEFNKLQTDWIESFPNLRTISLVTAFESGDDMQWVDLLFEKIAIPSNVISLELPAEVAGKIDLKRFQHLNYLVITGLNAEIKSRLLKNNPHLSRTEIENR